MRCRFEALRLRVVGSIVAVCRRNLSVQIWCDGLRIINYAEPEAKWTSCRGLVARRATGGFRQASRAQDFDVLPTVMLVCSMLEMLEMLEVTIRDVQTRC